MSLLKKLFIPLGAGLILIVIALLWFFLSRPTITIASILPEDTIFYARLTQADKYLRNIGTSSFLKEINAIDIQKVMLKNEFPSDKINQVKYWQEQIKKMLDNPLLGKVLGREVALAFCPEPVLFIRLKASIAAAEFLAQVSNFWGDDIALTHAMYRGIKINQVDAKNKKVKISYIRLGDLLVAGGQSPKALERVIDVYLKDAKPLSQQGHFIDVLSRSYPNDDGFAYLNAGAEPEKINEALKGFNAVDAFGVSFASGDFHRFKFIAALNLKMMTPSQRKLLSCPKGDNKSLFFVPANAIGYNWGNCYDFGDYWQEVQEQLHSSSPEFLEWGQALVGKIQKRLKIDIEKEVLPVLGNEAGFYLTDVDTRGMFPFPRFLFFIKINDRMQVNELLRRAAANPMVDIEDEEYGKVELRFMKLPFGANMDPGYAFLGDYLLVASSRQLLKKSIDVFAEPGRSLAQEKTFKQFNLEQGADNNSMTFIKLSDLALRAIALAEWTDKYLGSQLSLAASYKEQVEEQGRELVQVIDEKKDELKVAIVKLKELKDAAAPDNIGAIENLQREIDRLHDEINSGKVQVEQIPEELAAYDMRLKAINRVMFNAQNILIPAFKAMGTFDAQAVRMNLGGRFGEAEIFLK